MFKLSVILFFAFGSAIDFSPIDVERNADDLCIRADSKPGYCVPLNQCSFIKNILSQKNRGIPQTRANLLYAKGSLCASRANDTRYVCCEENDKIDQAIHDLSMEDCGRFEIDKITRGKEIKIMSRPWMALLNFTKKVGYNPFSCGNYSNIGTEDRNTRNDFTCSGTLINKRYVLTAAHCFSNQELQRVRLGEHSIRQERDCNGTICAPPVEDIGIERIFVHEKFSCETHHNDIALVKLSRDVEFRESITPICLPMSEILQNNVKTMQKFRVTGWGLTENKRLSDVPMEVVVYPVNQSICRQYFTNTIDSTQICAGNSSTNFCDGDSGGPLSYLKYLNDHQRFIQYGVVSFGSINCTVRYPGVYTNVISYIRWIAHKIATK